MVPSVTKYIAKANQANCKSDAATILVQLQADVADFYSDDKNAGKPFEFKKIGEASYIKGKISMVTKDKEYSAEEKEGDITYFSYRNGKYWIEWTKDKGWTEPKNNTTATP